MAIKILPRGNVPPNEVNEFFKFSCPPVYNGPNTDPKPPTFSFRRKLQVNIDLELPDGSRVPMWVIEDPDARDAPHPLPKDIFRRSFPSPTLRIPLNAVVEADVDCSGNTHTIHWHGIEPTPMNDGVGHLSFEVTGHFNYQFQPRQAGTFFYHCHKNTTLHFEMGLYGMLIIDPPPPRDAGRTGHLPDRRTRLRRQVQPAGPNGSRPRDPLRCGGLLGPRRDRQPLAHPESQRLHAEVRPRRPDQQGQLHPGRHP